MVLPGLLLASLLAAPGHPVSIQAAREKIVDSTMKYLNVPYLWGGTHPKTGLDCSAFVGTVFKDAGLRLPRVARDQYRIMKSVAPKDVQPGDLVFFSMKHPGAARVEHVGIYVGKGLFVHASVTYGVHVANLTKPYYLSRLIAILRYPGF